MTNDNSFWDRVTDDWSDFENKLHARVTGCLGTSNTPSSSPPHDYGAVVFDGSSELMKKTKEKKYSIFKITPKFYSIIVAFIISGLIIYGGLRRFDLVAGICFVVLGMVIYLLMMSMTGSNIAGSLNDTIYPYPPTLGSDGVSVETKYAGQHV